jgi:hypothetical protein
MKVTAWTVSIQPAMIAYAIPQRTSLAHSAVPTPTIAVLIA